MFYEVFLGQNITEHYRTLYFILTLFSEHNTPTPRQQLANPDKHLTKSSFYVILSVRFTARALLWFSPWYLLGDILTHGHFVLFVNLFWSAVMQVRSANSAVSSLGSVRNPMIIAFDRNWRELFRAPLFSIDCMSWGTREDYENGYRGIKINQAQSRTTHGIAWWATPSL